MTMKSDNGKKRRAFERAFAVMSLEEQRAVLAIIKRLIRELGGTLPEEMREALVEMDVQLPPRDVAADDGGDVDDDDVDVDLSVWGEFSEYI